MSDEDLIKRLIESMPDEDLMRRFIEAVENTPNIQDLLYAADILKNLPSVDELNSFASAVREYREMRERGELPS